jgi:hypothetical protein
MFRISKSRHDVIDAALVDEIEPAIRARKAGRCQIDQIERDPWEA